MFQPSMDIRPNFDNTCQNETFWTCTSLKNNHWKLPTKYKYVPIFQELLTIDNETL